MESDYYWYYTLGHDGGQIEGEPCILWYNKERNEVMLMGYDIQMRFTEDNYDIIGVVEPHGQATDN
jgi:hypothetical protein